MENSSVCKNSLGKTRGCQRLPQPGKDQCLPSAGNGVQGGPRLVPRRSVHWLTDHVTFQPKRSIHPANRLLWQFTTVTFRIKVDGMSVHPKLWHSDLVNLDSLSQSDQPTHCNILTQSLWHFVHVFFVQLLSLRGTVSWDFLNYIFQSDRTPSIYGSVCRVP